MSSPTARQVRDRNRPRPGEKHRKRLHVLRNPNKLAFAGWREKPDPWTMEDTIEFIEWCHIDRLFPEHRHNHHRLNHRCNLKWSNDPAFTERCIVVYQTLYQKNT